MIKTQELVDKINKATFENLLTQDPKIFCHIETIKDMKSIILFYQESWKVEYMPTEISEVEKCAAFYNVDYNAIKGLKKLAKNIHSFLISN